MQLVFFFKQTLQKNGYKRKLTEIFFKEKISVNPLSESVCALFNLSHLRNEYRRKK